jgi:hypothetical protein
MFGVCCGFWYLKRGRVPGQTHTTMLRASRKVAQGHTCRESRACRISTRRWGVAGADPLGTLSSGLGRQNHQSALMRCHQRHFPWSAVMMARVAWKRVDPDALLPIRRLVRRLIPPHCPSPPPPTPPFRRRRTGTTERTSSWQTQACSKAARRGSSSVLKALICSKASSSTDGTLQRGSQVACALPRPFHLTSPALRGPGLLVACEDLLGDVLCLFGLGLGDKLAVSTLPALVRAVKRPRLGRCCSRSGQERVR